MEKEIQVFEDNNFVKSDVAFDQTFSLIEQENDWTDEALHEYFEKHKIVTNITPVNGRNIDCRDFTDMMHMYAYLENLDTKEKFKDRALNLMDSFLNFEDEISYETKVMKELNNLFSFQKTAIEKLKNVDCSNPKDLEFVISFARLAQCFGTKHDEFIDLFEKNMSLKDIQNYDQLTLTASFYNNKIYDDFSKFELDYEKYPFAKHLNSKNANLKHSGELAMRAASLQTVEKLNRGKSSDKIEFDIDTEEIYKYAKLIKNQSKGKTNKRQDSQINDYAFYTSVYVESIVPPGTNEYKTAEKLGLKWYDLLLVNGHSLHELAGNNLSSYELGQVCPKLFIDACINKTARLDYIQINSNGKDVSANVKPVYINHDQEKYEKTFTVWDKIVNFFTGKRIKNLNVYQSAIHKANSEVFNEYNHIVIHSLDKVFRDHKMSLVNQNEAVKQINVKEVENDKQINLDNQKEPVLNNEINKTKSSKEMK